MPLFQCNYNNPTNIAMPAIPLLAGAPMLAPAQGDHVFGNIIGSLETSLQDIFGGGAGWLNRLQAWNSVAHSLWVGISQMDIGHNGINEPCVNRNGMPETDQHAHMFGGYANRLQWQLTEIVCSGFLVGGGGEDRTIFRGTRTWRQRTMGHLDALLTVLVDQTALTAYMNNPNQVRNAAAGVVHNPISLTVASNQANLHNGPGSARIRQICSNIKTARNSIEGFLMRFDSQPQKHWNGISWV